MCSASTRRLAVGEHQIPYIAPQDVQDATHVRVLLAKDAISTGWDCPRAEVLFSLRPAKDRTHITQLLGRMVRTPLARRIESDERLNAVSCFLPFFDRPTATEVARILTGEKEESEESACAGNRSQGPHLSGHDVLERGAPEGGQGVPLRSAERGSAETAPKPIKRLLSLAAEIALDELMDQADEQAMEALFAVLDGQLAQHKKAVEAEVEEIYTADLRGSPAPWARDRGGAAYRERADYRTVDDAFRPASRAFGAAVANAYTKRLA